jgi:hypothetical protein
MSRLEIVRNVRKVEANQVGIAERPVNDVVQHRLLRAPCV